jgi:hypothetical protein
MIRDKLVPSKELGHSDKKAEDDIEENISDEIDEDEAADARKFFGVL